MTFVNASVGFVTLNRGFLATVRQTGHAVVIKTAVFGFVVTCPETVALGIANMRQRNATTIGATMLIHSTHSAVALVSLWSSFMLNR